MRKIVKRGSKRNFDGRNYYLFDWCRTKQEAYEEVADLRRCGWLVRRTKAAEGYFIWRTRK